VNTSGALNNNNAYNGYGAVADCEKSQLKVDMVEIRALTQGVFVLPKLYESGEMNTAMQSTRKRWNCYSRRAQLWIIKKQSHLRTFIKV
jgi:hypothetical protein